MAMELGMLTLSGLDAYQSVKGGNEAQEKYNELAAEEYRQGLYAQRQGLEQMHDLTKEGRSAEGRAIADASASGLRVAGSTKTLTQRIRANVERRKAMVGFGVSEP